MTPSVQKVVVVVDLSRYSDIANELEQQLDTNAVAALNDQVKDFIFCSLAEAGIKSEGLPYKGTGDGGIIVLDTAEKAILFAEKLHQLALTHNREKTVQLAQRHFRVGVWKGNVIIRTQHDAKGLALSFDYAGMAISNAVRLEGACKTGDVLIGSDVWADLSKPKRNLFGPEEAVKGKRNEAFHAHRRSVIAPAPWDADVQATPAKPHASKSGGPNSNELLTIHKRRLAILEKQAATYGALTPPYITIEIEDAKRVIADLES